MERRTILKAAALAPTAALLPQTAHAKASLELSRDYATLNAHLYDFYEHKDGVRKFINQLVKASTDAHHRKHPYVRSKDYERLDLSILSFWLYGEAFWNEERLLKPEEVRVNKMPAPFSSSWVTFKDATTGEPLQGLHHVVRRQNPYETRGVSALQPYFFWLFTDPNYDIRPFEGGLAQEVIRARGMQAAKIFEPHLKELIR